MKLKADYLLISSKICFSIAIISTLLILTKITSISSNTLRMLGLVFGGFGILLNTIGSKAGTKKEINLLFWIGISLLFIGLVGKIMSIYVLFLAIIPGFIFSFVSYFYNPFHSAKKNDDELLDS